MVWNSLAKRLCSHLLDQLNHADDFQCSWCQFDQLPDERFAREAVEVAAAADLIVVATARASDLPPWVTAWLEKSLASFDEIDAVDSTSCRMVCSMLASRSRQEDASDDACPARPLTSFMVPANSLPVVRSQR